MTRIGKVLGISGSPRRDGNTELLLKEFLRGASASGHETELFTLNKFNISPCTSCDSCQKNGQCIIDDDMQLMYNKLLEADYVAYIPHILDSEFGIYFPYITMTYDFSI